MYIETGREIMNMNTHEFLHKLANLLEEYDMQISADVDDPYMTPEIELSTGGMRYSFTEILLPKDLREKADEAEDYL